MMPSGSDGVKVAHAEPQARNEFGWCNDGRCLQQYDIAIDTEIIDDPLSLHV